jgi:RNA polymerase sigma factor (sigma-70 family)
MGEANASRGEASAPRRLAHCTWADVAPGSAVHRMSRKSARSAANSAACPGFLDEYEAHQQQLIRLAALLTSDKSAAEAVVADAFVALHRAWKAVGSGERAWRYLLRLVIIRSRRTRRRYVDDQQAGMKTALISGEVRAQEQAATVTVALRAMPQHQREAIALIYYLDLSEDDAAAAMGVRKPAVQRLVAEGLTILGPALLPKR